MLNGPRFRRYRRGDDSVMAYNYRLIPYKRSAEPVADQEAEPL